MVHNSADLQIICGRSLHALGYTLLITLHEGDVDGQNGKPHSSRKNHTLVHIAAISDICLITLNLPVGGVGQE